MNERRLLVTPFARLDPKTNKPIEKLPEEKQYVLLLYFVSTGNDKTFEVITGRSATREYLIDNIDEIDIIDSYVLVEDVPFKDTVENNINVLKFLNIIDKYYTDDFKYILEELNQVHDSNSAAENLNDDINFEERR